MFKRNALGLCRASAKEDVSLFNLVFDWRFFQFYARGIFTARRYASAVYTMVLCLCVRHTLVLHRTGCMYQTDFLHTSLTHIYLHRNW